MLKSEKGKGRELEAEGSEVILPMNEMKGYVVLSPSASATDAASLAARAGVNFEKTIKMRIAISEAKVPEPDKWEFRPVSVSVVSAWAGDVQLHLGSIFASVMKMGGKAAHAEWNGFEINPRLVMKLIVALRLYDSLKGKAVNVENLIGLQYSFSSSSSELVKIEDMRRIRRYAEVVDTRSDTTLRFLKDIHRVWGRGFWDRVETIRKLLKRTRKLSYEEAVYMVERELNVCRLAARHLLKTDRHWSYYQWSAGKTVKVNGWMSKAVPYQPKFRD